MQLCWHLAEMCIRDRVVFAQILVEELKKIGLEDVDFINGVVYATKKMCIRDRAGDGYLVTFPQGENVQALIDDYKGRLRDLENNIWQH